tara:strand:+ start:981 stop:1724 length:744 start_codon:yes stop_codon:yes gene_type:complete
MAIKMTLKNVSIFITSISPIIIAMFFIIDSFLHMNINGLIWLIGIFISQLIAHLIRGSIINTIPDSMHPWIVENRPAKPHELPKHDLCEIFEPMYESTRATSVIDTHTLFHSFTLIYLIFGFIYSTNGENSEIRSTKNMLPFIIFYGIIAVGDIIIRRVYKCIPDISNGILYGLLSGSILGLLWWFVVYNITGKNDMKYTINGNSYIQKCKRANRKLVCTGAGKWSYNKGESKIDDDNKNLKFNKVQ